MSAVSIRDRIIAEMRLVVHTSTTRKYYPAAAQDWIIPSDTPSTTYSHSKAIAECIGNALATEITNHVNLNVKQRFDPTAALPVGPTAGDVYLSTATANGWTINRLYTWSGTAYTEQIPDAGFEIWIKNTNTDSIFTGTEWLDLALAPAGGVTAYTLAMGGGGGSLVNSMVSQDAIGDLFINPGLPTSNLNIDLYPGSTYDAVFKVRGSEAFRVATDLSTMIAGGNLMKYRDANSWINSPSTYNLDIASGTVTIKSGGYGTPAAAITCSAAAGAPIVTLNALGSGLVKATAGLLSIASGTDYMPGLANGTGWLHNNGAGVLAWSTPSYSDVGADASGAAATVQGNLNTHAGLTTTAHGLGASAFHADNYFALASHAHAWSDITSGVPTTWTPIAHNLLSAYHGDTTAASVVRGDIITGQGSTPKWVRLALGTNGYLLGANATDVVYNSLAGWGIAAAAHGVTVGTIPVSISATGWGNSPIQIVSGKVGIGGTPTTYPFEIIAAGAGKFIVMGADPTNTAVMSMGTNATDHYFQTYYTGTGSILPLSFIIGTTTLLRMNVDNSVVLGYPGRGLQIADYLITIPDGGLTIKSHSGSTTPVQAWEYSTSGANYNLVLNQNVSSAMVRWSFDVKNAGTYYANVLTLKTNFVGINMIDPAYAMDITGGCRVSNLSSTGSADIVKAGTGGLLTVGPLTAEEMAASVSGTINKVAIFTAAHVVGDSAWLSENATGVGIGTAGPLGRLHISGANKVAGDWGMLTIMSTDTGINNGGSIVFSGGNGVGTPDYAGIAGRKENSTAGSTAGYLQFTTFKQGNVAANEKMRITSDGNVGIGCTPTERLEVAGNVLIENTGILKFGAATNAIWSPAASTLNYLTGQYGHHFGIGSIVDVYSIVSDGVDNMTHTFKDGAHSVVYINNTGLKVNYGSCQATVFTAFDVQTVTFYADGVLTPEKTRIEIASNNWGGFNVTMADGTLPVGTIITVCKGTNGNEITLAGRVLDGWVGTTWIKGSTGWNCIGYGKVEV
jgi:hypothetical protein